MLHIFSYFFCCLSAPDTLFLRNEGGWCSKAQLDHRKTHRSRGLRSNLSSKETKNIICIWTDKHCQPLAKIANGYPLAILIAIIILSKVHEATSGFDNTMYYVHCTSLFLFHSLFRIWHSLRSCLYSSLKKCFKKTFFTSRCPPTPLLNNSNV